MVPVGVRRLRSSDDLHTIPVYAGVSYCHAAGLAAKGQPVRVLPGSIQVCRWAPVILGLDRPTGRFERSLAPRLDYPVPGLFLARLDQFADEPEAVIFRASPAQLWAMLEGTGAGCLWAGHGGRLDRSANPLLPRLAEKPSLPTAQVGLLRAVNRALALLARSPAWQHLTHRIFYQRWATVAFDALISRTLADMSMCRNSTAIPLLTGCVNVSFFCTGGITWGGNNPDLLTSGWPWRSYQQYVSHTWGMPHE